MSSFFFFRFFFFFLLFSLPFASSLSEEEKEEVKKFTQKEFEEALLQRIRRFRPKNLEILSLELWKREKALEAREVKFKQKEEEVARSQKALQEKIKHFQGQQKKILGCLNKNERDKKKRIDHMVEVFSNMRPANAAQILSVQDEEVSIALLELLPSEKVSQIFSRMDKEISARLQKQFLNMKK